MTVDEIIAEAGEAGLFVSLPVRGCSEEELESLERKYGLALPPAYRRFLELAGHASGLLFRWDHWAAAFENVSTLTAEERSRLAEGGSPPLPPDALVICSRLAECFEFIRTELGDSSPVWCYSDFEPAPVLEYPSVEVWLANILEGAREAQSSGFFAKYPRGTRP